MTRDAQLNLHWAEDVTREDVEKVTARDQERQEGGNVSTIQVNMEEYYVRSWL